MVASTTHYSVFLWVGSVVAQLPASPHNCPLNSDTNIVYSIVEGVGPASRIWVEDLLWWWKSNDPSIKYQALAGADIQACELSKYKNLRVFINPGGDAYEQLRSLSNAGRNHILGFINRAEHSAYVGFCAGGYMASMGYYWESIHEDATYFAKYGTAPPLGAFPYEVEGSIVDIADDQFGDLEPQGVKYRLVNISNGQQMLYYGGSTFGWNQAPFIKDPNVKVLAYYTDFYGYLSYNLPAAWQYKNLLLTSFHAEADNCTRFDCPAPGTIPENKILQNRAWLVTHINSVARTNFTVPDVSVPPSFNTTPPHNGYPKMGCYQGHTLRRQSILFCDDFDVPQGIIPSGLWNWQRTQTAFSSPRPWNTTYSEQGFAAFGHPAEGNGYAIASQGQVQSDAWASISTFPVATPPGSMVFFKRMGIMSPGGLWTAQLTIDAGATWTNLPLAPLSPMWQQEKHTLPAAKALQVRFNCGGSGYCGLDSVYITAPADLQII